MEIVDLAFVWLECIETVQMHQPSLNQSPTPGSWQQAAWGSAWAWTTLSRSWNSLTCPVCRTIWSHLGASQSIVLPMCVFSVGNRMKDWERMCVLASLVNMFFLVQVHGATQNSAWEFPGTLAERRCHRCVHPPNDACEARTNMGIAKQSKHVQALFMETVHFGYPLSKK